MAGRPPAIPICTECAVGTGAEHPHEAPCLPGVGHRPEEGQDRWHGHGAAPRESPFAPATGVPSGTSPEGAPRCLTAPIPIPIPVALARAVPTFVPRREPAAACSSLPGQLLLVLLDSLQLLPESQVNVDPVFERGIPHLLVPVSYTHLTLPTICSV